MKIIIEYPEDVTEQDALTYATGCFNPHQLDYKSVKEGYRQGVGFRFGDGRIAYFYRNFDSGYVLQVRQKET